MPAGLQHEPRHRLPTRRPDRGGDGAAPPDDRPRTAAGREPPVETAVTPGSWGRDAPHEPEESEVSAGGGRSSLQA